VNIQENEKKVSLLSARIFAKKAIVFTISILMTSVVIAYAAGYSIADFVYSGVESEGTYGGSNSRPSFSYESGYNKLLNLRSLGVNYDGAGYINRSGYVTGYSYPIADAALRAFISGDGVVKNYGAPAGTYGDAGGVSRVALFNDDDRSDFNIPESPTSGWSPSANGAGANGGSNGGSGGGYFIVFPLPDTGSGWGTGSGTGTETGTGSGPTPVPIPTALPLFGSGLTFLWILRRTLKKQIFEPAKICLGKRKDENGSKIIYNVICLSSSCNNDLI